MLDSLAALSSILSTPVQAKSPAFLGNTAPAKAAAAVPGDFTDMLSQLLGQATDSVSKAEAASIGAIQGKVSVQEAVEAVVTADQSLQAAIAVRDKITAAYLELSRMSI